MLPLSTNRSTQVPSLIERALDLFARAPHLQDMVFQYLKLIDPVTLIRINSTLYEELIPTVYHTIKVSQKNSGILFHGLTGEISCNEVTTSGDRFRFAGRKAKALASTRCLIIDNEDQDPLMTPLLRACKQKYYGFTLVPNDDTYCTTHLFPQIQHISYGYKSFTELLLRRGGYRSRLNHRGIKVGHISRQLFPSHPTICLNLLGYQSDFPLQDMYLFLFYLQPRHITIHTDKVFAFSTLVKFANTTTCKIIIHPPPKAKNGQISQKQAIRYYQRSLEALRRERRLQVSSQAEFLVYCSHGNFIGGRIWNEAFGPDQSQIEESKRQVDVKNLENMSCGDRCGWANHWNLARYLPDFSIASST